MKVAESIKRLREQLQLELSVAARLPTEMIWNFDDFNGEEESRSSVQKTVPREVVTLRFGRMQVREVIRATKRQDPSDGMTSLADLVPKGGTYGYDLICHIGLETLLKGRPLQDVAEELADLEISFSSFWDMQQKFLFYLGHLHREAAPVLREYFQKHGWQTCLIDGTVEPPGPVYFGIQNAKAGILLSAWKIATENADDIASCLQEAGELWGVPDIHRNSAGGDFGSKGNQHPSARRLVEACEDRHRPRHRVGADRLDRSSGS